MSNIERVDRKTLFTLVVTFFLTWGWVAFCWWTGFLARGPLAVVMYAVSMWVPGLVAIRAARREGMHLPIFHMGGYLAAGLLALLVAIVAVGFGVLLGGPFAAPPRLLLLALVALVAGLTFNPLLAVGEELMWRGYLWQKVSHLGPIRSVLLIGSIWGVWHAPMILLGHNYPGHPVIGVMMMVIFCVAITPLINWIRSRSGGVAAPAAFHGTINATGGLVLACFPGADPLIFGLPGVVGVLSCLAVLVVPLVVRGVLLRSSQ